MPEDYTTGDFTRAIVIPIYAFIAATYDGSLYALIFVSILMPAAHLIFERQNGITPARKQAQNI